MLDWIKTKIWDGFMRCEAIPFCEFQMGNNRVKVLKPSLMVVISDGRSTDALPIQFVSPEVVREIYRAISKKWFVPKVIREAAMQVVSGEAFAGAKA